MNKVSLTVYTPTWSDYNLIGDKTRREIIPPQRYDYYVNVNCKMGFQC